MIIFFLLLVSIINTKIDSKIIIKQTPITFNIDSGVDTNPNLIFKQSFNQSTINYCNFDPILLNDKRKKLILNNDNDDENTNNNNEFKINITMPYEYFNESSQINGNNYLHI